MTTKTEVKTPTTHPAAPAPAPARDLFTTLRGEIDRLFDDLSWPGLAVRRPVVADQFRAWMPALSAVPAVDLVERNGSYELTVELPGMTRDQIELRLTEGALTVTGEKSEETSEEKGDYHMSERRYGTLQRTVALPDGIDADKVAAQFENGVLKVTLPKSGKAKASERRIEVKGA